MNSCFGLACNQAHTGAVAAGWEIKRKERWQLHLWNLNSTSNSSVAPRRLSCQISANQHEAETRQPQCKQTRAEGNVVITNVISANQNFASTFFDADI